MCALQPALPVHAGVCLIMADIEPLKPSNTGWLVADMVTDTFAFGWARTETDPDTEDSESKPAPVANSPHIKIIPLEEILVYRTDGPNKRTLIGYQDEDLISTLLRSAIEGKSRRFYFLSDKSQLQDASENTPWATLSSTLRRQNIALTPIRLSDYDRIPDDAEGLALIGRDRLAL